MAGQQRNMEGNDEQRRKAARDARAEGKRPSAMGATQGASKQLKSAKQGATHQERLEQKHEGKAARSSKSHARPGNRDVDPRR